MSMEEPKALLTKSERVETVCRWLQQEHMVEAVARVVPPGVDPGRILRIAQHQVESNPELAECWPSTLLGSVVECAALGLEPGTLSQAWILPFWNNRKERKEAQLIPGYRGLAQLAYRHPKVCRVSMSAVWPCDEFEVDEGAGVLHHRPDYTGDRSVDPLVYYGVIQTQGGGLIFRVLTLEEVQEIRERSRGKNSLMWTKHFHEGGMKSALRRAMKLSPMTTETQRAVALDEAAELGQPQGLEIDVTPLEEAPGEGEAASAGSPDSSGEVERDPNTGEPIPDHVGRQQPLIPADDAERAEDF